ncbi:unnamed protein product [Trichobilharzia regenti]|nr:unnamed protein product [Trichobilharzia regenti]
MNKTDISTPNHMYDFLFHANSNSNNNDDDDDVGLKSTQHEDVDEDPKDLLSPTSTDLLQCNNNNNGGGGNILHNRSISSASASLSSSSSSSPCIDPVMTDEINSIGLENINYTDNNHDNNNTNNPTECETNNLSTSIGIESILGGGDHPLKIQTNNQYTMDKLKSIDAGNLFPSNNNNNNNHNINPNNTNNRSLKRSWSNRELLNAYNNHDPDHQDDGNDDHSIDHNDNNDIHNDIDTDSIDCVGIRSLSDDNSTINIGNSPTNTMNSNHHNNNNDNDDRKSISEEGEEEDSQQQQHQLNSTSTSPISASVVAQHLNSAKRRRRHQYVPQHLPVNHGDDVDGADNDCVKEAIDKRKSIIQSPLDHSHRQNRHHHHHHHQQLINHRGKLSANDKYTKSDQLNGDVNEASPSSSVSLSSSLNSPLDNGTDHLDDENIRDGVVHKAKNNNNHVDPNADDVILTSNGIQKADITSTNDRQCYFSAF